MTKIGEIVLPEGAGLSPMAGVTDAAMRRMCFENGCAWAVSEMLSAKGFVYNPANRNAQDLIRRLPGEGLAGLQLFGREPEWIARAAQMLEGAGFAFFDLNFGCPAPKIVGNGEGSALMKEPERIGRIARALVGATRLPVTAKIRSGWDASSQNAVEVARILEDAGVQAIAVHARTRSQFYSGRADWSVIRSVKRAVRIPVFGNGDVFSGADALRMLEETGCDRVLVGRGAQGNPWIFREILCALDGRPFQAPDFDGRMRAAQRHFAWALELYGERKGLLEMRKHIAWYISGIPGAARLRDRVNALDTPEAVQEALFDFFGKS